MARAMLFARRHLYILRETLAPFILGVAIFTFVLLMGRLLRLVELVLNKGVPLADILKLFAYLLPSFLVLTLPLAFLLAVLLGFGRLSADAEVVALKSSGVSLYDMARPVLVLALAVSLLTALLTFYAEPQGKRAFRDQVFEIAHARATVGVEPRIFNDEFDGLVLYANSIDDRSGLMQGLFISDERIGREPAVILARSGRAISDPQALTLTLRLQQGAIHRLQDRRGESVYQIVEFDNYDIQLDLGRELRNFRERQKRESEMSLAELGQAIAHADAEEKRKYLVERHQRLVMPLAPVLFALIGIPLGIQSQRSSRGGGFALALAVFLAYYLVFSFAETLGHEGLVPPAAAMWLPNLVFLAAGIALLRMTAREKRLALFDRLDDWGRALARRWRNRRLK
ncbi:LPS export ABC transporter permease LptF [Geoalkalibacter halelectricus]|uniref:LPS export ABC transporter permease LptF n=1 Tax=Geoalkalibacter halelectricus TaxID=2847045 RepID=A0ABY5ZN96_9BACT|nr:LPS export ABC transporter permease LptF [Geoalkalibacter halelectricus]MDO3379396.1 LPS export ABC transporter permease LptF [Geoalkalibacter halelectricus]UWZ78726.1 LPS export ABC transporter permease LptF [Geoalkalibacter halelectricus]